MCREGDDFEDNRTLVDDDEDMEDRDEALLDDHNYNVNSSGLDQRRTDDGSGEYRSRSSPRASGVKGRHRSSSLGSDQSGEGSPPPITPQQPSRRAISTAVPATSSTVMATNYAMSAPPAEPLISRLSAERVARNRSDSGRPLGPLDEHDAEEVEQRPSSGTDSSAYEADTSAGPVRIPRAGEPVGDVGSDEATISPVSPPLLDDEDMPRIGHGSR